MTASFLDIILLTIIEWKNELHGRVRLHKTVYLAQKIIRKKEIKFRPYYYGPYSDELSSSLTVLENLKLVDVNKEIIEQSADGQHDIVEYIYSLKDEERFKDYLTSQSQEELKKWQKGIKKVIDEFKESGSKTLKEMAMSAKILFILADADEPIATEVKIRKKAEEYKWEIDDSVFVAGLRHLENLELIKRA